MVRIGRVESSRAAPVTLREPPATSSIAVPRTGSSAAYPGNGTCSE